MELHTCNHGAEGMEMVDLPGALASLSSIIGKLQDYAKDLVQNKKKKTKRGR